MRIGMTEGRRLVNIAWIAGFVAFAAFAAIRWLVPAILAHRIGGWDLVLIGCGSVFLLIMFGSWTAKIRSTTTCAWLDDAGVHESDKARRRDVPWSEVSGVRFDELEDDICVETAAGPIHVWSPGLGEREGRRQRAWVNAKLREAQEGHAAT